MTEKNEEKKPEVLSIFLVMDFSIKKNGENSTKKTFMKVFIWKCISLYIKNIKDSKLFCLYQ